MWIFPLQKQRDSQQHYIIIRNNCAILSSKTLSYTTDMSLPGLEKAPESLWGCCTPPHNKLQILDRPAVFFAKCNAVLQVQRHSALRKENQL